MDAPLVVSTTDINVPSHSDGLEVISSDRSEISFPREVASPTRVQSDQQTFKLSKRRWATLFAMFVFGFTSALTDEVSPILHVMVKLLDLSIHKYVYICQLFLVLPALLTIPTAWFIDRYGIKATMYGATLLMLVRNSSRALFFNPDLPHWDEFKMVYWIISGMAGMQTLVIFYCTPLKISENWFATSERAVAWTVMLSSSSIGVSIAAYLLPRFVHGVQDVKPMFYLNIICAIVTSITIITCITKSKPDHPPSERTIKSATEPMSKSAYLNSFKKVLTQKDLLLHLFHEAIFDGVLISVMTVLQDILTSSGHTEIFVGNVMSINSILSITMLVLLATFVHRVKDITLNCKIAFLMKTLMFITYLVFMNLTSPDWTVLGASIIFNTCTCWAMPNSNNMVAHLASGIISEAAISGIASTLTITMISLSNVIFVSLTKVHEGTKKSDYTHSMIFASSVCIVTTVLYLIFFEGKSKIDRDETNGGASPDSETNSTRSLHHPQT